jgi:hypothetical protein
MIHKAMEEFYVFVSSEDSLENFADNSGGQFRVQFSRTYPMKDKWECVLLNDIVSPRKFSLTNWTLHVGGFPSPVTSSYKLLTVVYRNEADKNVIVLKTTSSQTVVLQSDFQLIKLKGSTRIF